MSYSMAVRAKTKQQAKEKVEQALRAYSFDSPHNVHCRDGVSIASSIHSRIDCFAEVPEGRELVVEAYGTSSAPYSQEGAGDLTGSESSLKVYLVLADAQG